MTVEVAIDKVVIRERSRREMRKIDVLAESIKEIGLLHPPVVRQEGKEYVLVAGQRRIEAMRLLGFDRIPVTVVRNLISELSALRAEGEENNCREPFTPSEAVVMADRMQAVEAARAKERQQAGQENGRAKQRGEPVGANVAPTTPKGKTRDRVADAVGLGHTSLAKARAVVDAAKDPAQPPEVRAAAEAAVEQMDATRNVNAAFNAVQKAKAGAERKPIEEFLNDSSDVQLAKWRGNFAGACGAITALAEFPPADVAIKADADDLDDVDRDIRNLSRWWDEVQQARQATSRLRVVGSAS